MNRHAEPAAAIFVSLWTLVLLFCATLALSCPAQADITRIVGARTMLVEHGGRSTWLLRETPLRDGGWIVLRRRTDSDAAVWSPVATFTQTPTHLAHLGERLAVLFADGSWTLVGSSGPSSGPPLPDGFRAVALCTAIDGRLAFVGRDPEGGLTRFDFDGASFVVSIAIGQGNMDRAQIIDAPTGLVIASRDGRTAEIRNGPAGGTVLARLTNIDDVHLLTDGPAIVLITRSGETINTTRLAGRSMSTPIPLATDGVSPLAFAWIDDGLVGWWFGIDGQLRERRFGLDGQPLGPATPLVMARENVPPLFERVLYVVGAATLLLILFVGGRQTVAATRGAAPLPVPAPLARRLAAGLIDLLPLAFACGYLGWRGGLTTFGGALRFDTYTSEAILAASVLFYIVLIASFELKWKRSLGKMLFALRVVSLNGSVPRSRAILIRNLLRLVDLNIVTLLIVPLTPMRQRLGDFLAATTVVDAADPFPTPRETRDDLADK